MYDAPYRRRHTREIAVHAHDDGGIGAALQLKFDPRRMIGTYAVVNVAMLLTTMLVHGPLAMWSVIAIGLFNSIMFPTIFTLVIDRLGPLVPKASSLLVMAIFGGAVIPYLQGHLVDFIQASSGDETTGLRFAFVLPALCYAYIIWYGMRGSRRHATGANGTVANAAGVSAQ